jgi:hypothetical protein
MGRELESIKAPKVEPVAAATEAPTMEQFGFDQAKFDKAKAEWDEAVIDRKVEERIAKREAALAEKQQGQTFAEREAEYEKANPGYRDRVYSDEAIISKDMAAIIKKIPEGPAVADYLANNPEISKLLYQLPAEDVALEMGAIRAQLKAAKSSPTSAPVVQISKAPAPVPKIEAVDSTVRISASSPESDTAWSADEWARRRNKELAKKKA